MKQHKQIETFKILQTNGIRLPNLARRTAGIIALQNVRTLAHKNRTSDDLLNISLLALPDDLRGISNSGDILKIYYDDDHTPIVLELNGREFIADAIESLNTPTLHALAKDRYKRAHPLPNHRAENDLTTEELKTIGKILLEDGEIHSLFIDTLGDIIDWISHLKIVIGTNEQKSKKFQDELRRISAPHWSHPQKMSVDEYRLALHKISENIKTIREDDAFLIRSLNQLKTSYAEVKKRHIRDRLAASKQRQ